MKRRRSSRNKRGRFDYDNRRGSRPILAQPVDERAPVPEDGRLLAELRWIEALRHGCIPADRPAPSPS